MGHNVMCRLLIPRHPLADKFLHGTIVSAYTYQHTKYQHPGSINLGAMEGVPK